jgi:hypothetical protein
MGTYLINEDIDGLALPLFNQLCGIMFGPLGFIFCSKIPGKGLLAPWTVDWIRNWRKCRYGLVLARIAEEQGQRSVSTWPLSAHYRHTIEYGLTH